MKSRCVMRPIWSLWSSLCLLFAGACSEGLLEYESRPNPDQEEWVSIAHLKSLVRGKITPLTSPLYIEGRVTANDHFGEFPQSLFLQDESGAIEVKVEGEHLYQRYPLGLPLRLLCDGLYLERVEGKVILGAPSEVGPWVEPISERDHSRRLHPLEGPYVLAEPQEITLSQRSHRMIGMLVALHDMAIREADGTTCWCDRDPLTGDLLPTLRTLEDLAGENLYLYTPPTAIYAAEPLPLGRGSLYGILDYREGEYLFRLVNRDFLFR